MDPADTAMRDAMETALVSGAGGFIGRALCRRLAEDGVAVVAALRKPVDSAEDPIFPPACRGTAGEGVEAQISRRTENVYPHPDGPLASLSPSARGKEPGQAPSAIRPVVVGNIDGATDWSQALAGVEVVFHLAARVHVLHESAADPLAEFRATNVAGTERLACAAAAAGARRLVYVSSIGVNGLHTSGGRRFSEADAPQPHNAYAQSKWEAEQALHRVAADTGLQVVIVRPPLVYGPGAPGNYAQMLAAVARGVPLPFASVRNQRSLVYVGNLVDALIACARHPAAAGQTYLVSDGEDVSTPELLRRLARALGVAPRMFPCPAMLLKLAGRLSGRSAQVERLLGSLQVDSGKIRRELNWLPPYTLQQGLQIGADWRCGTEHRINK